MALFRTLVPPGGTGSLAGPCPLPSVRQLALFRRGLGRVQFVITLYPKSACPLFHFGGNWLCLYHRSQRRLRRRPRRRCPLLSLRGIGFVWHASAAPRRHGRHRRPSATGTARGKLALFRTHAPREASGPLLRLLMILGRSRRNPPKLWSLVCQALFCCPVIIQVHQFLVK